MFPYVLCSYARLTLLYPDILTPNPLLTQTLFAQSLYNSFRPPNCPTPSIVCTCSSAVTVSCARIMYVACSHSLNKKNVSLSLPRCGLCAERHMTSEHRCGECDFFADAHEGLAHCGHTRLCCPHCAGSHMMCDSACRVWTQRSGAGSRRTRRKRGGGQEDTAMDVS